MSFSDYQERIEEPAAAVIIDEAFYVAPTEQWELSDFEDLIPAV